MAAAAPDLPDSIIHHIQSFLTMKESAQTALLSKSWRDAWFTRPTLVLDEADFEGSQKIDGVLPLVVFANKTFRRYKESKHNNTIHTFRLHLWREWFLDSGLATKWTSKALTMGATDLTLQFDCGDGNILVPIDKLIQCPGLKSLTLANMDCLSNSFFNMIACCPLIQSLSLSNICLHGPGTMTSLGKLRSLVIFCLYDDLFHTLLLGELSSKFPNLKDLTLTLQEFYLEIYSRNEESDLLYSKEVVTIASNSLEIFNFTVDNDCYHDPNRKMRRVELHLPSIRKFTFETHNFLPELYLSSTTGDQWESHLSIKQPQRRQYRHEFSTAWFRRLSKFLTWFKGSKIHLCLHDCSPDYSPRIIYEYSSAEVLESTGVLECLRKCEVEDVTIDARGVPSVNVILNGLFQICRPKLIAQYIAPPYDSGNARNSELFQFLDRLHDLEEVNVLDEKVQQKDSTRRLRFRLKWKPCVAA